MKRRALLLAAASSACATGAPRRPFAESMLAVARNYGPLGADAERFYWSELEHLSALVRTVVAPTDAGFAAGLSRLIFQNRGFVREVDDTDLRFVLLPSVLRDRRGSCVGLGSLYLALAEAVGVPAHGVLRPGHFYVRFERGGSHTNVELLRRGEVMPDDWYALRFPAPIGVRNEYGRPLTQDETLGVIAYNVGNQRRRERRIDAARSAYAHAVQQFPDFAEAHASLGAVLHLLGRVDEARASYRLAMRLNPQLPDVERNLSLLDSER
jgi:regulator of sirC expression with transglutaminase-like and TPR domain